MTALQAHKDALARRNQKYWDKEKDKFPHRCFHVSGALSVTPEMFTPEATGAFIRVPLMNGKTAWGFDSEFDKDLCDQMHKELAG